MGTADRPVPRKDPPPAWMPLPGAHDGRYLLFERRGDPCCSNAALVRIPGALILIDPGSDTAQAGQISLAAAEAVAGTNDTVLLVLTHAHWDHFAALPQLVLPASNPVRILAHHGLEPMLAEDARMFSQAFLFNADCPPVRVDVPLLAPGPRVSGPGAGFDLVRGAVEAPDGHRIPCETVGIAGREAIQVFHAPGHSPDGLCLRIGDLLWVSDLFLAANPAVAGIRGWNGSHLCRSLRDIGRLLDVIPVELCCPGHGRAMLVPRARQALAAALEQASSLGDVATLDPSRVRLLVECAEELLREGHALFTVIAGRLCTIAYHLESLDESPMAAEVLQAMDIAGLDEAIEELGRFAEQFRVRRRLEVALPLKGIQTVGRIGELFDTARLRGLIDPLLLRRAQRLLDDFVYTVRGIDPPATRRPCDARALLNTLVARLRGEPAPAWDLDDADDAHTFRLALTRRLAAGASVNPRIDLDVRSGPDEVFVDPERAEEVLHAIVESFAGERADTIGLSLTRTADGAARIEIQAIPPRHIHTLGPTALRFQARAIRRAGGALADASTPEGTGVAITLEPGPGASHRPR